MGAEECPPEVWGVIFSLACRDDGSTAVALSQVSRSINAYSKPYRYQSIALMRCEQIIMFESVVSSLPPELRRIKNLFVRCSDTVSSVYTRDSYEADPDDANGESQLVEPEDLAQWEDRASEEFMEETDSEADESDSPVSDPNSDDSFYELSAKEQVEMVEEVEELARMPSSPIPLRVLMNLDWLNGSLSALDRHLYAILSAFRRTLEAGAHSLETLTIHWKMYDYGLLEVMLPELPVLQDLSMFRKRRDGRPSSYSKELMWSGPPTIFPSLKRLQITGYLEEPTSSFMEMSPSLMCLHTNDTIIGSLIPFIPETLREIVIHAQSARHRTSHTIKKDLFGERYMEGVGKYARLVGNRYPSNYKVWLEDWLARINGEGDAVSCRFDSDS